ncbi:MAG: amidohydrolase [Candidatus Cloacimonadaceae bacterium]
MNKLFINAHFHTMNKEGDIAKALLVKDGLISEVIRGALPHLGDIEIIDLQGCHVFPGFIDTHTHSFEGGLYSQSLDLSQATTLKQVLEMIDAYYSKGKTEKTEQLDAFRFDENKTDAGRFPYVSELDKVCPDIPLVLRRIDGHSSVVNNAAWKKFYNSNQAKLSADLLPLNFSPDFILRGGLNDQLVHWFHANSPQQVILKAYQNASRIALANGITTVHSMVGDSQQSIMHYEWLRDNLDKFEVGYILYPQSFNLKAALDAGATRIGGCILADGALGSYTAALRQPYQNKSDTTGQLYQTDEFWKGFINQASEHNLQVAVHCIGDKAIRQINDVYLSLSRKGNRDLRHQLIHCELTPDDLLDEIVQSGAIPVMQPAFDLYWGAEDGFYQKVLGTDRKNQMNRFRTFFQRGVPITGGSDWYITELDALQGIRAAVSHHNPEERISPFEAVKMYTVNAAFLSHDENRLGRLETGFEADFVCLEDDILDVVKLDRASVRATYKQGREVFSR